MIYVFGAYCRVEQYGMFLERYGHCLPEKMIKQAASYSFRIDACRYLLGKILLLEGLKKMGIPELSLDQLKTDEYNKPYFEAAINFNISHAGDYVLCAISPHSELGIDIECVQDIKLADFFNCFTDAEQATIGSAPDPMYEFYRCWTRKESIIKADGRGLGIPLRDIDVLDSDVMVNSKKWYIKELTIADNYIAHLASDKVHDQNIAVEFVFPKPACKANKCESCGKCLTNIYKPLTHYQSGQ